MSDSPTSRSLRLLREDGYTVQVVEHFNHFARRRVDLFGWCDVLGISDFAVIGVQATTGDNAAARRTKIQELPGLVAWLRMPGRLAEVHGWSKRGGAGERKLWGVVRWRARLSMGRVEWDRLDTEATK